MGTLDLSPMAVTVQAVGTLLLCVMLAQLGRVFARGYAQRWAAGFLALFVALSAIWLSVRTSGAATWAVYLVLEWTYLLLLWAGCRELVTRVRVNLKYGAYVLPVAIAAAALLTYFAPTFNDLFVIQALLVAT